MYLMSGKIIKGEVVVGGTLEEGSRVTLLMPEGDESPITLIAEERAFLKRSIEQADRGELIDARTFLDQLGRGR